MNDRRRGGADSGFDDGRPRSPTNSTAKAPQPQSGKPQASSGAQGQPRPPTPRTSSGTIPHQGAKPPPPRTSSVDVPQRTSSSQTNPRVPVASPPRSPSGQTNPRVPVASPPRSPSSQTNPRVPVASPPRTSSSLSNPRVPAFVDERTTAESPSGIRAALTMNSKFADDDDERTQLDTLMGGKRREVEPEDDESTVIGEEYDGKTPAKEVVSRDLWKAINAPVQSRVGRRTPQILGLLIDQFAVGHNPRYEPDAPDRPRAHIFVWDVTRAMSCEVPHFVGPKELTLSQTVDWLRHEGPMRGWRRVDPLDALQSAQKGLPVIVVPKDIKLKLMGICRPGAPHTDGKPKVAAAAKSRGNSLTNLEALGTNQVEYFVHQ